eukprot:753379-Hanusia_phi.AAC.1
MQLLKYINDVSYYGKLRTFQDKDHRDKDIFRRKGWASCSSKPEHIRVSTLHRRSDDRKWYRTLGQDSSQLAKVRKQPFVMSIVLTHPLSQSAIIPGLLPLHSPPLTRVPAPAPAPAPAIELRERS